MNRGCVWLVALFMLAPQAHSTVFAQEVLRSSSPVSFEVADGRVDGSHIEPFSVVWTVTPYTVEGEARASNRVEETVSLVGDEAHQLLRFTQAWYDSLGAVVFTTVRVAERETMAYRAFHTGGAPGGFGHLDLDGVQVSGVYVEGPEGPSHYYSLKLDSPVFASFAGLLFSAFPLEAGLVGDFPAFGWGGTTNPALSRQQFKVVGREMLTVPGSGRIESYRVETSRSPGSTLTHWISREAPYFVKAESRSSNGAKTLFEVERWTASSR